MNVRLLRHAVVLAILAAGLTIGHVDSQEFHRVRVTYYLDRGVTFSGGATFAGVAACSWGFEMGTRLRFLEDGREVVCLDRGQLGNGRAWVDVWVPTAEAGRAMARTYGDRTRVEVVP